MRVNKNKSNKSKNFSVEKYIGVSLSGPKKSNTSLAIIESYVKEKKVFLSHLIVEVGEDLKNSSDTRLIHLLKENSSHLKGIAVDAPLMAPKCMRCSLKCPGIENCTEEEIVWLKKWRKKREPKKRPNKWFSPYLERCVENYLSTELETEFNPDHAWGSNKAPLYARAHFLRRRFHSVLWKEVNPKLSLWRLGKAMHVRESDLKGYRHPITGEESRALFLDELIKSDKIFIYNQDLKKMIRDAYAFESFINAFTLYLDSQGLVEKKPKGFPKSEAWILFPQSLSKFFEQN